MGCKLNGPSITPLITTSYLTDNCFPRVFNCIDLERQCHAGWAPMSITLGADVTDIGFRGGCARAPVGVLLNQPS